MSAIDHPPPPPGSPHALLLALALASLAIGCHGDTDPAAAEPHPVASQDHPEAETAEAPAPAAVEVELQVMRPEGDTRHCRQDEVRVTLKGSDSVAWSSKDLGGVEISGRAADECSLDDRDGDGRRDLTCRFSRLAEQLGAGTEPLEIRGTATTGGPVLGAASLPPAQQCDRTMEAINRFCEAHRSGDGPRAEALRGIANAQIADSLARASGRTVGANDGALAGAEALCLDPEETGPLFWRVPAYRGSLGEVMRLGDEGESPRSYYGPTTGQRCAGCHAPSPDGRHVAVTLEDPAEFRILEARSRLPIELTFPAAYAGPATAFSSWNPADPNLVAVSLLEARRRNNQTWIVRSDLYVVDVASGRFSAVAGASEPDAIEMLPAWSPDGRQIAFVRGPAEINQQTLLDPGLDIYVVETGPDAPRLARAVDGASEPGRSELFPAWSPDGRWLAYSAGSGGPNIWAPMDIYVQPAEGPGSPIAVTTDGGSAKIHNTWPTWSPDSRRLNYSSTRSDPATPASVVWTVDVDESGPQGEHALLPGADREKHLNQARAWLGPAPAKTD